MSLPRRFAWLLAAAAAVAALAGSALVLAARSVSRRILSLELELAAASGQRDRAREQAAAGAAAALRAGDERRLAQAEAYAWALAEVRRLTDAGEYVRPLELLESLPAESRGWEHRHLELWARCRTAGLLWSRPAAWPPNRRWMAEHPRDRGCGAHENFVAAAALSPDGRTIAAGTGRGWTWLLAADDGRELRSLEGHEGTVQAVAFDPAGRQLATGGTDLTVRCWDAATGRPGPIMRCEGQVLALAFDASGGRLAAFSAGQTVTVFDPASGRELEAVRADIGGGHMLALCTGQNWSFSAWASLLPPRGVKASDDPASPRPQTDWPGRSGYGYMVGPGGQAAAEILADDSVQLYRRSGDGGGYSPAARLAGHTARVRALAFSPDGRLLATGSRDGTARLWSVGDGRELAVLRGHAGQVGYLAFDGSSRKLATVGWDCRVMLWSCPAGRLLATLTGFEEWEPVRLRALAFSADGSRLFTAGHRCSAWDLAPRESFLDASPAGGAVGALAFSPDGRLLAGACRDGAVALWNVRDGSPRPALRAHAGGALGVAFSPDGKTLASGGADGAVRLWDPEDGRETACLDNPGRVTALAFDAGGDRLALAAGATGIRVWQTGPRRVLAELRGGAGEIAGLGFVTGGRLLASSGRDGTVRLAEVPGLSAADSAISGGGGPRVLRSRIGASAGMVLDPAGRLAALVDRDGTPLLLGLPGGGEVLRMRGRVESARALAMSPDGRRLAVGGADGAVSVWDCLGGRKLLDLTAPAAPVSALAFSPDGAYLAAACGDGRVRIWLGDDRFGPERSPGYPLPGAPAPAPPEGTPAPEASAPGAGAG